MGLDALGDDYWRGHEKTDMLFGIRRGDVPSKGVWYVGPETIDEALLVSVDAANWTAAHALLHNQDYRSYVTYAVVKRAIGVARHHAGGRVPYELEASMHARANEIKNWVKEKGAIEVFRAEVARAKQFERPDSYISKFAYGMLQCAADLQSVTDVKKLIEDKKFVNSIVGADAKAVSRSTPAKKNPEILRRIAELSQNKINEMNKREADEELSDAIESIKLAVRKTSGEYVASQILKKTGLGVGLAEHKTPVKYAVKA